MALACLTLAALAPPAQAQDRPPDGMTIARVEFEGLTTISEAFVRRLVATRAGQPYSDRQVQNDVRELLRSRKFLDALARAYVENNQAVVVFEVREKPEVRTIELIGNKVFTDDELFKLLSFSAGSVLDRFEINRGVEAILDKYKEAGHYYAEVTLDEAALRDEQRVVIHITEGPRVKVRKILFEGARSYPEPRLYFMVHSQTYFPILRKGAFDEQVAEQDAAGLQTFYQNEGYLDARVGYRLDFDSVDRTNLNLVFVIEEGPRYRVSEIQFRGNEAFDADRLRATIGIMPGDFYRDEQIQQDLKKIRDLYGEIGYVDIRAASSYEFLEKPGLVLLHYDVTEGTRSRIGRITIRGNVRTQDRVIRRELRFYPGEDFNTVKTRAAEQRILETSLFDRATITPLDDVNGEREALVEVEPARQIDFLVGVGVSTDSGVLGSLNINNRNFDLFDWPRTWGEFFRGQAFRGAGQRLRLELEPGNRVSRFRIGFTEPYLLDKPVRLDTSVYLFQRQRDSYDEERLGFVTSLGRRFESGLLNGWAIEGAARFENVKIDNLRTLAANDIHDARGNTFLTSLKLSIVRDTTDSRLLPSRGYRASLSWEQVGALGGDASFGKPIGSFAWYKTVRTDVLDRKSILATRADVGFIAGEAPVFERFFAGGFGSIRGFDFQGVSPRQGLFNDRVGGDFILLLGSEYSMPLYAKNIRGVAFLDMGTVEKDFTITDWRASVGVGLRINVNFFGPVPIVLDWGFPISSNDQDDMRLFNFSFGASF